MQEESRAERFLMLYRRLEGLLEKRYMGHKMTSSSVVMEYLRDPDSGPCRIELDMCREIRNLLSHNASPSGTPVVEPAEDTLGVLERVIEHVQEPRMAVDYGTPRDSILFAHPNDSVSDLIRHMQRAGYSHVPVRDRNGLIGVFSAGSVMSFLADRGLDELSEKLRVGDLGKALGFGNERNEKYLFLTSEATLPMIRDAFEKRRERNSRLAAVFITEDGTEKSEILAMLTPWDVLKDL